MAKRAAGVAAGLILALGATPLQAASNTFNIPAQDLASALRELATRGGVELLFDAGPMAGRRSAPVRGARTPEIALRDLLTGSGFVARRSETGALMISPTPAPPASSAPALGENTAVAELLVVGSRSLNTAIRRSENDIQPYAIFGAAQIAIAQVQTVEEFLRTRDPHNIQAGSLSQTPVASGGAVRSRINFGGLGTAQTLVLVDGRRMPSIPGQDVFEQSDLNGIPTAAIERIESLTSTAGGIFGPGATGGVVNVVLKRDYNGGVLSVNSGVTDRGDARHYRVDGRWGHVFFDGDTRVMLAFSHTEDDGLAQGDRDITARARQRLLDNGYVSTPWSSASLNISASTPLPGQVGGGYYSHKPIDLPLASGGLAALTSHYGALDTSLSPDGQGAMQSLLSRSRSDTVTLNLRQAIGARLEMFVDTLYARTDGWAVGPRVQPIISTGRRSFGNPYRNTLLVTFPTPGLAATSTDKLRTLRATAGAIARLGRGWSASADLTYGKVVDASRTPNLPAVSNSATSLNLFDGAVSAASLFPTFPKDSTKRQSITLADLNLRASGPVMTLPAGAATVTVLGELRRERQPEVLYPWANLDGRQTYYSIGRQIQAVASAYAELRAPLFGPDAAWPLRQLDLQLAGRWDDEAVTAPADDLQYKMIYNQGGEAVRARARTVAFTAGLRAVPVDGLMVRASLATGYLPPTPEQLLQAVWSLNPVELHDPLRASGPPSSQGIPTLYAGSPDQQPEHARTISVGLIASPGWTPGLRLSLDYTRIDKSHEITRFAFRAYQFFLDHETLFPDRVTRAPLTPADIAAGYTGGEVTKIDASDLAIGRSIIQTFDLDARYQRPSPLGDLQLYARATWEPDFRRKDNPDAGFYQTSGRLDGPLPLRGNLGLDWSRGRWRAGLNVQVYGRYDVTYGQPSSYSNLNLRAQGQPTIPAQAYADFNVAYVQSRAATTWSAFEYRLGMHNLFDTRPPLLLIDADINQPQQALYYSPYGDPRGRRFELSVTARF